MRKLLFLALLFTSCAQVPVTQEGSQVRVLRTMLPSELSAYQALGEVECGDAGKRSVAAEENIRNCHNAIRNEAAQLGAEFVLVSMEQMGNSFCPACIYMSGTAYKKR